MVGFWELSNLFICESRWPTVGNDGPNERALHFIEFVEKSKQYGLELLLYSVVILGLPQPLLHIGYFFGCICSDSQ